MKAFVVLSVLVAAVNCQYGAVNPGLGNQGMGGGYGNPVGGLGNPGLGGGYGNPVGVGGYGNPMGVNPGLGAANGYAPALGQGNLGNAYGQNAAATGLGAANSLPQGYGAPLAQGYLGTQGPIVGQPGGPQPGLNQALRAAGYGKK